MKWVTLLFLSSVLFASSFETDISKAFLAAKQAKKPLLISFYGIWCPPCNELEETVFESLKFIEKAKGFTLLKVDADKKESWELKNRYHIGGYPTVVFASPLGKEIYRVAGYRTPGEFLRIMDIALNPKAKNFEEACKGSEEEELFQCAVVCSERENKACAEKTFGKLRTIAKPGTAISDIAETYFADNAPTGDLKRNAYETLLRGKNLGPQGLVWATSYVESFVEKVPGLKPNSALLEKVLAQYEAMTKDARQEKLGIPVTDMLQMKAELLGRLGKAAEAHQAWLDASNLLESKAKEMGNDAVARGFSIERIECLESAGMKDAALELANSYLEKFPQEFTFHYQAASLLEGLKRYPEAIKAAEKAFSVSYGDNQIRAATLLIQLYGTIPDLKRARAVFDKTSKDFPVTSRLPTRTHRYLKKLQESWNAVHMTTKS